MDRLLLTFTRFLFRDIGKCCPGLFAHWAIRLWGKTRRPAWRPWEEEIMATAQQHFLSYNNAKLACYQWGQGSEKVLLLPGWNSRAAHFRNYIEQLVALDYQVIGIDPVGHGRSSGHWTNIRQYLDTIELLTGLHGPFYAVIGHSFGGFTIPFALANADFTRRAVLLATPVSLQWLYHRFCHIIRASNAIQSRMQAQVEDMLGADCWQHFDIRYQAPKLARTRALILHDEHDSGVPLQHARDIQASWPGAELLVTQQLGHQRVLRHPGAVKPVIAFLQQA